LLDDDLVLHLTKVFSERGASRSETSVSIRPLAPGEADACEQLLRSLPEWFGIERAIIEYRRALDVLETFVGQIDGELAGFLALERHSPHAAEIHVMAVSRPLQARGIGSALLEHAERRLLSESVEYLEVKTLGPSRPDANYERTRKFYLARGFRAIKETDLWGKDNPCLILVKHLNCSGCER
jgi:GNAT superfamily N-acetyltransferase